MPMSAHFWIFLAAVLGGLAVVAGAIGAHVLPDTASLDGSLRSYTAAQHNHALHALALLGVALLMLQSEGYRASFSSWAMQAAAAAFAIGIVLFSGGIYAHVAGGFTSTTKFVPVGGMFFIAGWAALAIGALGLRG
jgi:uncharacterized membrane protein YgdD (TMEM256/DUF423 family)